MKNLLIVDEDNSLRKDITHFFRENGYDMDEASDYETAVSKIERRIFDVIISDYRIPGGLVTDLLEVDKIKNLYSMIIIAAQKTYINEAVKAIKLGAFDYIQKPFSIPEIEVKVKMAIEHKRLREETDTLRGDRNIIYSEENFIGESEEIKEVFEIVKKIAPSNSSVLLTGETGTGKELIAGAIHFNSFRAKGPFVKVNCAALPENLLESELFGHEKGAFTGAERRRIGRFEEANGGTIFLDEIGDMSLTTQAKVLRVLQEKEFQRLGSNETVRTDVRIISATNKDLVHEIEVKKFRADLFYRLNVVSINIPPLRQRRGDIIILTYFFQKKFSNEMNKKIAEIHPIAIKHLTEYSWPGNIRELENTIERAILMADDEVITPDDLRLPMNMNLSGWDYNSIRIPTGGIKLEEVERKLVLQALKMTDWVQKDAAKLLGVTERVFNYKIKRFGITHPRWKINK